MKELDLQSLASWLIAIILAWFFVQNGWPKIVPNETIAIQFKDWGYNSDFARLIGILEVAGAVLVLFPRTAFYGALLLTVIMIGAIYTHLSTEIGSPAFAIFLLVLAIIQIIITRRSALLIGR